MNASDQELRRLVACPKCALQYEAGDRAPGSRFHCACGEVLTVDDARPHDAKVVRCSSCGAARQRDARSCAHCSADFTLHELDLHTMCPGCMSRISDRAGFCHSCGLAIVPQGEPGELSDRQCPVCGEGHRLRVRSVEADLVTVLECERCAGLWVGHRIFKLLESRAHESVADWPDTTTPTAARLNLDQEGESFYRACVQCGALMHRKNYGRRSGVIIDVCRDHGIWFDLGELDEILAWVRAGGARRSKAHEAEEPDRRQTGSMPLPAVPTRGSFSVGDAAWFVGDLIELLIGFLGDH